MIGGPPPEGETMRLSPEQLKAFDDEGYLFLPDCFSDEEVALLRREAELIYGSARPGVGGAGLISRAARPGVWSEKPGAPRPAFAAQIYNEGFRLLGNHPRLIEPVE